MDPSISFNSNSPQNWEIKKNKDKDPLTPNSYRNRNLFKEFHTKETTESSKTKSSSHKKDDSFRSEDRKDKRDEFQRGEKRSREDDQNRDYEYDSHKRQKDDHDDLPKTKEHRERRERGYSENQNRDNDHDSHKRQKDDYDDLPKTKEHRERRERGYSEKEYKNKTSYNNDSHSYERNPYKEEKERTSQSSNTDRLSYNDDSKRQKISETNQLSSLFQKHMPSSSSSSSHSTSHNSKYNTDRKKDDPKGHKNDLKSHSPIEREKNISRDRKIFINKNASLSTLLDQMNGIDSFGADNIAAMMHALDSSQNLKKEYLEKLILKFKDLDPNKIHIRDITNICNTLKKKKYNDFLKDLIPLTLQFFELEKDANSRDLALLANAFLEFSNTKDVKKILTLIAKQAVIVLKNTDEQWTPQGLSLLTNALSGKLTDARKEQEVLTLIGERVIDSLKIFEEDWTPQNLSLLANGILGKIGDVRKEKEILNLIGERTLDLLEKPLGQWTPQSISLLINALSGKFTNIRKEQELLNLIRKRAIVMLENPDERWLPQNLALLTSGMEKSKNSEEKLRILNSIKKRVIDLLENSDEHWMLQDLSLLANVLFENLTNTREDQRLLSTIKKRFLILLQNTEEYCPPQNLSLLANTLSGKTTNDQTEQEIFNSLEERALISLQNTHEQWAAQSLSLLANALSEKFTNVLKENEILNSIKERAIDSLENIDERWTAQNLSLLANGLSKKLKNSQETKRIFNAIKERSLDSLKNPNEHWTAQNLSLLANALFERPTNDQEKQEILNLIRERSFDSLKNPDEQWTAQNLSLLANAFSGKLTNAQKEEEILNLIRERSLDLLKNSNVHWQTQNLALLANALSGKITNSQNEQEIFNLIRECSLNSLKNSNEHWSIQNLTLLANALSGKLANVHKEQEILNLIGERVLDLLKNPDEHWPIQNLTLLANALSGKLTNVHKEQEILNLIGERAFDLLKNPDEHWTPQNLSLLANTLSKKIVNTQKKERIFDAIGERVLTLLKDPHEQWLIKNLSLIANALSASRIKNEQIILDLILERCKKFPEIDSININQLFNAHWKQKRIIPKFLLDFCEKKSYTDNVSPEGITQFLRSLSLNIENTSEKEAIKLYSQYVENLVKLYTKDFNNRAISPLLDSLLYLRGNPLLAPSLIQLVTIFEKLIKVDTQSPWILDEVEEIYESQPNKDEKIISFLKVIKDNKSQRVKEKCHYIIEKKNLEANQQELLILFNLMTDLKDNEFNEVFKKIKPLHIFNPNIWINLLIRTFRRGTVEMQKTVLHGLSDILNRQQRKEILLDFAKQDSTEIFEFLKANPIELWNDLIPSVSGYSDSIDQLFDLKMVEVVIEADSIRKAGKPKPTLTVSTRKRIAVSNHETCAEECNFIYMEYQTPLYQKEEKKLCLGKVNKILGGAVWGVFAREDIEPGTDLGLYLGEEKPQDYQDPDDDYIFERQDQTVVTAIKKGNWTRCLNHSAVDSNLDVKEIDRAHHFVTRKKIKSGEQLLFSYGKKYFNKRDYVPAVLLPQDGVETVTEIYGSHRNEYFKKEGEEQYITPIIEVINNERLEDLQEMFEKQMDFSLTSIPCTQEGKCVEDPYLRKTVLHFAVLTQNIKMVERLLLMEEQLGDKCFLKHQVTTNNQTALHLAALIPDRKKAYEMMKVLLKYGLDVDAQNFNGQTALHIAIERGDEEMVKLLFKTYKAERDLLINVGNDSMNTILYAIKQDRKGIYEILATGMQWRRSKTDCNKSVLHLAVEAETDDTVLLESLLPKMSEKDLTACCVPDSEGKTPLFSAYIQEKKERFDLLLAQLSPSDLKKEIAAVTKLKNYGQKVPEFLQLLGE